MTEYPRAYYEIYLVKFNIVLSSLLHIVFYISLKNTFFFIKFTLIAGRGANGLLKDINSFSACLKTKGLDGFSRAATFCFMSLSSRNFFNRSCNFFCFSISVYKIRYKLIITLMKFILIKLL